eukprot:4807913-Pleurochrysis_carterae.AAC.3
MSGSTAHLQRAKRGRGEEAEADAGGRVWEGALGTSAHGQPGASVGMDGRENETAKRRGTARAPYQRGQLLAWVRALTVRVRVLVCISVRACLCVRDVAVRVRVRDRVRVRLRVRACGAPVVTLVTRGRSRKKERISAPTIVPAPGWK